MRGQARTDGAVDRGVDARADWVPVALARRGGGEGRRSLAFEYLVSDSFSLELESDPDRSHPLDYNAHIGATFDIDGTQVSTYVPNDATFPMLTLAWTHEEMEYRLYVMPVSPFDPPIINPAEFAPLVANVRYDSPTS
jgi:hypothetical protein